MGTSLDVGFDRSGGYDRHRSFLGMIMKSEKFAIAFAIAFILFYLVGVSMWVGFRGGMLYERGYPQLKR